MKLNKTTKILITGSGGMLGDAFYNFLNNKCNVKATDIDINTEWLEYLDVRDFEEYKKMIKAFKPEIILHLAALTDLEYCEKNIENTYLTNTTSVENAVILANSIDATLVYISTAGIFDGKKDEYDDWDLPNPINVYGRSKYMGEIYVEKNMDKYFVFRAGWMMGSGPKKDKKFIQKIMQQIKEGKKQLSVVDDKLGTPTYTYDFAKNVISMLETDLYGIYNLVCDQDCSRFDVAEEILKILELEKEINIEKVNSDYFAEEYFAPRPASEKLVCSKLRLRQNYLMNDWKLSLKEYLVQSYADYL
jgi:dTDP-4-dehydrorhamnose reductase